MESLIDIVVKTSKNLKDKLNFLKDQKQQYLEVKSHFIKYQESAASAEKGLILGEFIISSSKIYLNIGYEYYVEKSEQEALQFVGEKLQLIDQAIDQFEVKSREAKETLRNLKQVQTTEEQNGKPLADDSDLNIPPAENDEGLPFMEIREELDDEGNIVASAVSPTAGNKESASETHSQSRIEEIKEDSNHTDSGIAATSDARFDEDFETNIRERTSGSSRPSAKEADLSEVSVKGNPRATIDHENMYTFDGLVRQLELQDSLEDGDLDNENVHYDFNSFQSSNDLDDDGEDLYDTDDDYDEYAESEIPSIVPEVARSRFMEQLNELRRKKERSLSVNEGTPGAPEPEAQKEVPKPAKKVGFAPELDVIEVENLKKETKANTFTGAIERGTHIAANAIDDDGFDPDLFAKLIGAKGSDEIHDKYQSAQDVKRQEEPIKRGPRVSRFKKDRSANRSSDSVKPSVALGNDLRENDPRNFKESGIVDDVKENTVLPVTTPEGVQSVRSYPSEVPREATSGLNPSVSDVTEVLASVDLEGDATSTQSYDNAPKNQTPFKSNLRSLQKPSTRRQQKTRRPRPVDLEETEKTKSEDTATKTLPSVSESKNYPFDKTDTGSFPAEVIAHMKTDDLPENFVQNPSVDFNTLGENLDDMARAYILGLYNADVEDPGTVLESLDDFKTYNKEAESLQSEISTFLSQSPTEDPADSPVDQSQEIDDGPVSTDLIERQTVSPADYAGGDDPALNSQNLHHDVAVEYQRLRQKLIASQGTTAPTSEELQLEPIDEHGNPIKTSRFKSSKLRFDRL
ncbi:LADA_0A06194g1_1 [Lachancea dasiensis]|uniref:LADA_0A06194g1_1 n=1 Tax=Lachancea dasiensis TaxID=1072105 RepID=A0A1G4IPC4_9SACH|nr:LADA_0A06194g1_1 [Lachancea dasiensis]